MSETFLFNMRIYYQDTDVGGVVYHSKYIDYAERARMELLIKEELPPSVLMKNYQIGLMIKSCNIVFNAPAFLEDEITVKTKISELKGASMVFKQSVFKGDKNLVDMDIVAVCVNMDRRPQRLPEELKKKLEKYI